MAPARMSVAVVVVACLGGVVLGAERFPPPDFGPRYQLPPTEFPSPRAPVWEYVDVVLLVAALALAAHLALKRRSRRGLFVLGLVALAYFGFWRKGCVCSIGAIQNVTEGLFGDGGAAAPWVIAFFFVPLVSALFFGRVFCAAVCPLGAIQDAVARRPIQVPLWLEHALGLVPYVYLGLAVLLAAIGANYLICQYDPFVAFFRLSGSLNMLILGACFLVIGVFVGRPYCRFLCPYGALLRLVSKVSKWHVTITLGECVHCRLCEDACPFGAIRRPTPEQSGRTRTTDKKRLALLIVALPVLIGVGGLFGRLASVPTSRMHRTVGLARRLRQEETGQVEGTTDSSDAFRGTGRPAQELYEEARKLRSRFAVGGWALGCWVGLVVGMKLIALSVRRTRTGAEPDRGTCFSCARCFAYCPVERKRLKEIEEAAKSE